MYRRSLQYVSTLMAIISYIKSQKLLGRIIVQVTFNERVYNGNGFYKENGLYF